MPNRMIRLKYDGQQVLLHMVRGEQPAEHYARESGSEILTECLPVLKQAGIDADN